MTRVGLGTNRLNPAIIDCVENTVGKDKLAQLTML